MLDQAHAERQQVKPEVTPNCFAVPVRKIGKAPCVMLRRHSLRVITDTSPAFFFA